MSGEQAEERTAREGRAEKWFDKQSDGFPQYADELAKLLAAYALSECSRLASRVEELENTLRAVAEIIRKLSE